MAKFPLDENQLYDFLRDLSLNISLECESDSHDLENQIYQYGENKLLNIHPNTVSFIAWSSRTSYFYALKTIEKSIKKTLRPELDEED